MFINRQDESQIDLNRKKIQNTHKKQEENNNNNNSRTNIEQFEMHIMTI